MVLSFYKKSTKNIAENNQDVEKAKMEDEQLEIRIYTLLLETKKVRALMEHQVMPDFP